jgi:CheY-like chemotaxis protein
VASGGPRALARSCTSYYKRNVAVVLLVDDDPSIRGSLSEYLAGEGFDVLVASHGVEALEVARRSPRPDVIVLDLLMPIMDGWDFRSAQLAIPDLAPIPVVVLSACGFSPGTVLGQLQVEDYLTKPFSPDGLVAAIRKSADTVRSLAPVR